MTTLYITDKDVELSRRGERVLVRKGGRVVSDIPLIKVDNVVVVGNAPLTAPLVQLFLDQSVPVSYVSWNGRFRGRLQPAYSKNAPLRRAQHLASVDSGKALAIAREFVVGKLANCRARLQRAARSGAGGRSEHADAVRSLGSFIQAARRAGDLNALRGVEGIGTRAYFAAFRHTLTEDGFSFDRRTRRPPKDPVNAMLSFGYALLQTVVDGAVHAVGFDPYIGFLHGLKYGKPALVLDLMEEFRPIAVDAVVATVINKRMIRPDDFVSRFGGVVMSESARRTFLGAFEDRIREEITHPVFGYPASLRRCAELQARILAKVLLGELESYVPFRVR